MVYDLNVEVPEEKQASLITNTLNINGTISTNVANYTVPANTYSYMDWTWYTKTVYKYQLICPKCKTTNWGELDEIITCSGKAGRKACLSNLRAVSKPVDFDIPVGA